MLNVEYRVLNKNKKQSSQKHYQVFVVFIHDNKKNSNIINIVY